MLASLWSKNMFSISWSVPSAKSSNKSMPGIAARKYARVTKRQSFQDVSLPSNLSGLPRSFVSTNPICRSSRRPGGPFAVDVIEAFIASTSPCADTRAACSPRSACSSSDCLLRIIWSWSSMVAMAIDESASRKSSKVNLLNSTLSYHIRVGSDISMCLASPCNATSQAEPC